MIRVVEPSAKWGRDPSNMSQNFAPAANSTHVPKTWRYVLEFEPQSPGRKSRGVQNLLDDSGFCHAGQFLFQTVVENKQPLMIQTQQV